ncbi:response regulator transcription factor [Neolewinella aurantiaca]|uniref:Phosphate regulon transcriptional regulatory protein PhoB n=1 Tax=Neolewinella aurantiaca TaxID=2602767 RepID=A0A5C7FJ80_9BACT|nr:response regulator transcription factor [Neolewinella aurantiaca]TXF91291.1 response regulator transcription factor [Neolewinella aurantiaca]
MNQAKILLVDDEPDILEILEYNLKKEGYEVATADNGEQGLKRAKEFKPDLIILDIMMPIMDGVEVCRQLRAENDFDSTIITFLTAREEDYSQIAALDTGGDDYITKPIRPRVFLSRVKALLRRGVRKVEEAPTLITIGDIEIDLEQIVVRRGSERIELAKKEFDLLTLLASKPGKVFSRDEIFNRVWGADVIVGNRTIDVHIRKLREKLGDHYIKTIKGIGYKFVF